MSLLVLIQRAWSSGVTHPHLGPLDLPLISVLLIAPPFALEVVQNASEGILWLLYAARCVLTRGAISTTIALLLDQLALLSVVAHG